MAKNIECREGQTIFRTKLFWGRTLTISGVQEAVDSYCSVNCRDGCDAKRIGRSRVASGVRITQSIAAKWVAEAMRESKEND